jgi:hypothetical protein
LQQRHHSWEDAKTIEYLESVDKRYGTKYSIVNNTGTEERAGIYKKSHVPENAEEFKKIMEFQFK